MEDEEKVLSVVSAPGLQQPDLKPDKKKKKPVLTEKANGAFKVGIPVPGMDQVISIEIGPDTEDLLAELSESVEEPIVEESIEELKLTGIGHKFPGRSEDRIQLKNFLLSLNQESIDKLDDATLHKAYILANVMLSEENLTKTRSLLEPALEARGLPIRGPFHTAKNVSGPIYLDNVLKSIQEADSTVYISEYFSLAGSVVEKGRSNTDLDCIVRDYFVDSSIRNKSLSSLFKNGDSPNCHLVASPLGSSKNPYIPIYDLVLAKREKLEIVFPETTERFEITPEEINNLTRESLPDFLKSKKLQSEEVLKSNLDEIDVKKFEASYLIKSVDKEKRFVLGPVLVPEEIDLQRDIVSEEEIQKAAWAFMEEYGTANFMHTTIETVEGIRTQLERSIDRGYNVEQLATGVMGDPIVPGIKNILAKPRSFTDKFKIRENYLAPVDFDMNGFAVKKGTWMLGVYVVDELLWEMVKSGKLTGFSIEGESQRIPEDML